MDTRAPAAWSKHPTDPVWSLISQHCCVSRGKYSILKVSWWGRSKPLNIWGQRWTPILHTASVSLCPSILFTDHKLRKHLKQLFILHLTPAFHSCRCLIPPPSLSLSLSLSLTSSLPLFSLSLNLSPSLHPSFSLSLSLPLSFA